MVFQCFTKRVKIPRILPIEIGKSFIKKEYPFHSNHTCQKIIFNHSHRHKHKMGFHRKRFYSLKKPCLQRNPLLNQIPSNRIIPIKKTTFSYVKIQSDQDPGSSHYTRSSEKEKIMRRIVLCEKHTHKDEISVHWTEEGRMKNLDSSENIYTSAKRSRKNRFSVRFVL